MTRYLDTSVVINIITEGSAAAAWDREEPICLSRLVGVEGRRALLRLHAERRFTDEQLAEAMQTMAQFEKLAVVVPISETVCRIASGPFPTPLRALDAIHLATAVWARQRRSSNITFATHGRQLAVAARALEFEVFGV